MFKPITSITKLTTATLKSCAMVAASTFNSLSNHTSSGDLPSQATIDFWVADTQRGLDAFFNDQFDTAQYIFTQYAAESPFHAVGYALMGYVEAMLGFESERITVALVRLSDAQALAHSFAKRAKNGKDHGHHSKKTVDNSSDIDVNNLDESCGNLKGSGTATELDYELLEANCMLMSATIQFLRDNWIDYMKAAYKLRKAYRMYEHMFENITGITTEKYAARLRKDLKKQKSSQSKPKLRTHRINSVPISSRASLPLFGNESIKDFGNDILWGSKKTDSNASGVSIATVDKALQSGVFFGVGLFALIFSLLPPKANKLLNTLGFHSSRPFALHLLHTSYSSYGLYSPLSALTLLAYYTNLSLFVHPQLLPYSLRFQDARSMLDKMKDKYPNGRIWMLVDGKLCKLEGFTRRGVETLRDARRRESLARPEDQGSAMAFSKSMNGGMAQLQALAVYEMGWGQIWLGDYFQASETFFRLESMNNWSRAFYHYIATCCMFADEEYDKAAIEFLQIPDILRRQKQLGGRLLPNEIFAERKILGWKKRADILEANREARTQSPTQERAPQNQSLNGEALRKSVIVNPLWELIYLWNGIPHVNADVLMQMKNNLQMQIAKLSDHGQSDTAILYLLYATVIRELGNLDESKSYLSKLLAMDKQIHEDRWVIAYGMYEMAIAATMDQNRVEEARKWVYKAENFFQGNSHYHQAHTPSEIGSNNSDYDWENRLHVRCQLLLERLEEM
ncbi:hypothetical protein BGW37DRAFT_417695 [Umbelopsis sp. PMI_123]|nr:hypothetical protein BGW37DRAFT_417695 [Umbelopsis sp. PMI_123]